MRKRLKTELFAFVKLDKGADTAVEALVMKFVFFFELSPAWQEEIAFLGNQFPEVEFVTQEKRTERDIEEGHAFIGGWIHPEHLRIARELKILFLTYTGPNFLPIGELAERGIRISNTHGNAQSVAERGIALAMSFFGKIIDYHNDLKRGKWHGHWGGGGLADTWESLYGKRCAIIGTGAIGKWIARFLKVFDCQIVGFKKRPIDDTLEYFNKITTDLHEALEGAELVFITLPLTEETQGMFDAVVLSEMKDKFLVNLGRAEVVDEAALYNALNEGVLKGAGIDVWYDYPRPGRTSIHPSKFPFHELSNVVLSPHIAGLTTHAVDMNIEQTMANIRSYLETGLPHYEVNLELMY